MPTVLHILPPLTTVFLSFFFPFLIHVGVSATEINTAIFPLEAHDFSLEIKTAISSDFIDFAEVDCIGAQSHASSIQPFSLLFAIIAVKSRYFLIVFVIRLFLLRHPLPSSTILPCRFWSSK